MQSNVNQPNFILKRTFTASEAVSLLTQRFPILSQTFSTEELKFDEPFSAYERLGSLVHDRFQDEPFLRTVAAFIDELASSDDPLLENVLNVSLLEKIAEEPTVASALKAYIGPKAADLLQSIEKEVFGRE